MAVWAINLAERQLWGWLYGFFECISPDISLPGLHSAQCCAFICLKLCRFYSEVPPQNYSVSVCPLIHPRVLGSSLFMRLRMVRERVSVKLKVSQASIPSC